MMFVDVMLAEVSPKGDGINLTVRRSDDGKKAVFFLEVNQNYGDINLILRDNHNLLSVLSRDIGTCMLGLSEAETFNNITSDIYDIRPILKKLLEEFYGLKFSQNE